MNAKSEITIQVIVHATEDIEKITSALSNILGIEQDEIEFEEMTGHFNNPVTHVQVILKKKRAQQVIERIVKSISKEDKDEISSDLEDRIQDSNLYLRFSKQEFVQGRLVLQDSDAIRIIISVQVFVKKQKLDAFRELIGIS